jgi:tetratricopeptide (TPR) repeat protein
VFYLTIHQVILVFIRIHRVIRKRLLRSQLDKIKNTALKAFQENKYEEAIKLFHKCIDKIPVVWRPEYLHHAFAVLHLCSLYRITENLKESEKYLNESLLVIGDDHPFWYQVCINEGDLFTDLSRYKDAETSYLKALAILSVDKQSSKYKTLVFNMHSLYMQMGQVDQAEKYLKEC